MYHYNNAGKNSLDSFFHAHILTGFFFIVIAATI